ncbi:uncharacterized membrane protein YcaP (DUF421 family) [Fontibacillus phaseoli]|uniref:Uncharacterized membrane protein YcaP (DUF421 family) n=1 Tax=Fontibacillus phaseoli TaxID=1416533 RepID=A0A369BBW4_9BACL|nr:DUF421 domain-containing protein [Fontibacillus phaseoli]RCX18088.1 uncharacterized membrane protein YcaP (DUF421 family) [Fontibacillus phaseoli]
MDIGQITLKLVIGFIGLWLLTRLLGKKEISQLTPFDFVSSLMLSELVGNTVYQKEVKFIPLLFALFLWGALSYLFEKVTQHARRSRGVLDGKPSILIRDGEVDLKELKKNSLDFDQLRMLLRQHDVFFIREVAYAIFEANGSLSVMKKPAEETVTRRDLGIHAKAAHLSYCLIEDGEIHPEGLELIEKNETWLREKLKQQACNRVEDVAYAEWKEGEGLYILKYKQGSFRKLHSK